MSVQKSVRALVSGRVQGVFFRQSTRQVAESLNITGYARNLLDGRVEVEAHGATTDIAQLLTWLRKGPEFARVDQLEIEEIHGMKKIPDRFITL